MPMNRRENVDGRSATFRNHFKYVRSQVWDLDVAHTWTLNNYSHLGTNLFL
jgi:hypothetical protein